MKYPGRKLSLWGGTLILVSLFLHFQKTWDYKLQTPFFDPVQGRWIIDEHEFWGRLFFYSLPKGIAILLGIFIFFRILKKIYSIYLNRSSKKIGAPFLIAEIFPELMRDLLPLGYIILLPLLVGLLKALTGQACPCEVSDFGGKISPLLLYVSGYRCFPCGHGTVGFLWIGMGLGSQTPIESKKWTYLGVSLGLIFSLYQMMKGAHFLSDVLGTWGLALVLKDGGWLLRQKFFETNVPA